MSRRAIGQRIGAILSATEDTINFLGFGTYVGDEVPPPGTTGAIIEIVMEAGMTNPKLVLDNGDVVWGAQCWWGPEDRVSEELKAYRVVNHVRLSGEEGGQ